jgi:hypothetical protein
MDSAFSPKNITISQALRRAQYKQSKAIWPLWTVLAALCTHSNALNFLSAVLEARGLPTAETGLDQINEDVIKWMMEA